MSDLVERLRNLDSTRIATAGDGQPSLVVRDDVAAIGHEAADEIERLRTNIRPLDGWWWCETHELPTSSEEGCELDAADGSDCGHLVLLYVERSSDG